MAGSCTWTNTTYSTIKKLKGVWLSHTDGVVTSTEGAGSGTGAAVPVSGQVLRVEFVPDAGGTAPDDQYDCTLLTDDSIDVLYGQGANLSGTNTVALVSNLGVASASKLALTVSGAGSANGGTVYVYLR